MNKHRLGRILNLTKENEENENGLATKIIKEEEKIREILMGGKKNESLMTKNKGKYHEVKNINVNETEEETNLFKLGHYDGYYVNPETKAVTIYGIGKDPDCCRNGVVNPNIEYNRRLRKYNRKLDQINLES